jgi:hypothetical protein
MPNLSKVEGISILRRSGSGETERVNAFIALIESNFSDHSSRSLLVIDREQCAHHSFRFADSSVYCGTYVVCRSGSARVGDRVCMPATRAISLREPFLTT